MNVASSPAAAPARNAPEDREARLHGRWLVIARAGWVALTLLILTLSAIAIPRAVALLQSVCRPDTACLSYQLTQADVRQLQQLGLSPGFLAAYTLALDVGTLLFYTALAALIFWRRSADRMALFCAYMLVLFGGATYTGLLDLGLRTAAPIWFWLIGSLELPAQVSVPTFFLLFPTGRFVPRWTGWGVLVFVLYEAWYVFFTNAYIGQNSGPAGPVFAVLILCLVGVQIYRYRRVSSIWERQQTKWVVFGLASALGGFALLLIAGPLFARVVFHSAARDSQAVGNLIIGTVSAGLLLLIPVSIAIAILRAHLFDIDVIIRRTLVYGTLTALLAAVYFTCVLAAQEVVQALTGQRSLPSLVIVASTLLVAALFNPLRRRIQRTIDRRFFRAKYDAARTLDGFAATLRQDVDLADLCEHLLGVVNETMQPTRVSIWLRAPDGQPGRPGREGAHV